MLQRDRRHAEHSSRSTTIRGGGALGNPKCGESLAGTPGHDQVAAIIADGEDGKDLVDGELLVLFGLVVAGQPFDANVEVVVCPVDRGLG